MAPMSSFDFSGRHATLDAKRAPLVESDATVPSEEFRPTLKRVWLNADLERKSRAERKPMDATLVFKTFVLSALCNLSNDQIEYQVRDWLSFMGLGLKARVPAAKTAGLHREALAQAGKVEELLSQFVGHLSRQAYIARSGQMLAASIVPMPRNRTARDENAVIKNGEVSPAGADKPAKPQKNVDARWTKNRRDSYYGYKNHVHADGKHKLVRRYEVPRHMFVDVARNA